MTLEQRRRIEELLIAAMTSGLVNKGPEYRLPESLAIEYGRLCYNLAVRDMLTVFRAADFGQTGLEIVDRLSDLHLTQRVTI
jgi:hypothetical protein